MLINRRNLLKASLASLGVFTLPSFSLLNAAEPVLTKNGFPMRFVFMRKSNGMRPRELTPPSFSAQQKEMDEKREAFETSLAKQELVDWLQALDPYKDRLTIMQGLSCMMSENAHESHQSVMGAYKSKWGTISAIKRATVDFELAKLSPSPFGHIEYSFASNRQGIVSGYSAPGPYQKNSCYADSITAYNDLFKCVLNPASLKSDNNMLDFLRETEEKKLANLSATDRNSIKTQMDVIGSMRARNDQIVKMSARIEKHLPDFAKISELGAASNGVPAKQEAMTDVLISSLVSGMTNVICYTIDNLATSISGLPGYETETINIHGVGHGNTEEKRDIRRQMDILHVKQIKAIADALKAQPEGEGTMFDNTMIMYFAENGETHHGTGVEEPFVILSGKNCRLNIAGKYIRLPFHGREGHQTLGNWYTTLLNAHGNPIKHYGDLDATMARNKLPQEGPIKSFMKA